MNSSLLFLLDTSNYLDLGITAKIILFVDKHTFPRNESGTIVSFLREDANLIVEKQILAALLD